MLGLGSSSRAASQTQPPSTPAASSSNSSSSRHSAQTPASSSTPRPATFAKPSAKKTAASATPRIPETPAPIRAIRRYTSDSDQDEDDLVDESNLVTPKPNPNPSSYALQTPRNASTPHTHHINDAQAFDNLEQDIDDDDNDDDDDDDDGAFADQDPDDLTMPVFPMHRKPNSDMPTQPNTTPTSAIRASAAPEKPAGLPKHMLARKQAGYSSPTDKILSPVSSKLSRSSVPTSKPAVGDLSPLFAKAKITDQKHLEQLSAMPSSSSASKQQRAPASRLGSASATASPTTQ